MTSETKKQFKKKLRNLRLRIRISKVLNIFLNKNDSKKNISKLNNLSSKVESLMVKLKKGNLNQDNHQVLDVLKGNYKKINNSIYKNIFKKIRTNISNVFKNTVKLVGKIINTTQKVTKSLIENIRKQILINKIKKANDNVVALGGASQLPVDLYSKSLGGLVDLKNEVLQEKYELSRNQTNKNIPNLNIDFGRFAEPDARKRGSTFESSKNTPLRNSGLKL
ncbi:MAG: hypothetical protein QMC35_12715 [Polaribacter sp.]